MKKRKYKQKARAEQAQETRQLIVEAAAMLHEELGPAQTTIKAIAEQAGVQRLTVYRHFPDESSLFKACSTHWFGLHPPPAVSGSEDAGDPINQTSKTLRDFYHYYRKTERMWQSLYRDIDEVEALRGPMSKFESYIDAVRDELLSAWKVKAKDKKQLSLTLRHCLRYSTWYSLKNDKLSDKQMVDLVTNWLATVKGVGVS
jgi:AcrR family transcriptional regulator